MSMSMPGRRVAGPFWAQAVNQKKTTFTNRYLQIAVPTMLLRPARSPANVPIVCSGKKL